MSPLVTLRIELPRERGPERELGLGGRLTLGRLLPDGGAERLVVPGRWLGVVQDGMVSAELLRIVYQDVDDGRAVIGWRTRAQHHPTGIRFGALSPGAVPPGAPHAPAGSGAEPDLAGEGRIVVGPGEVRRLVVSRLSTEHRRFLPRFSVQFAVAGRRLPPLPPPTPPGKTQTDQAHHWLPLVEDWWQPRRKEGATPSGVTWQRCLQVTFRLVVAGTPEGALASAVAEGLRHRGHPEADADVVRKAWTRAMTRLVEVLADPDLAWMVPALAVPGLAAYLGAGGVGGAGGVAVGGARPRLPAGETQIRHLVVGLRATGRAEWQ